MIVYGEICWLEYFVWLWNILWRYEFSDVVDTELFCKDVYIVIVILICWSVFRIFLFFCVF